MLFGHNSDVKVGDAVYHVQTEDRGPETALIDTTVYSGGRVLHRRTNNYLDLLPLDRDREDLLRQRIDNQHRSIAEEIRSGALKLVAAQPPARLNAATAVNTAAANASSGISPQEIALELVNAKSWLAGGRANLQVAVRRKQNGAAVPGAKVVARVDGSAGGAEFSAQAGADGLARIEFDMPRVTSSEPALVIEAAHGGSKAQLKFHLRARPRVPTA